MYPSLPPSLRIHLYTRKIFRILHIFFLREINSLVYGGKKQTAGRLLCEKDKWDSWYIFLGCYTMHTGVHTHIDIL